MQALAPGGLDEAGEASVLETSRAGGVEDGGPGHALTGVEVHHDLVGVLEIVEPTKVKISRLMPFQACFWKNFSPVTSRAVDERQRPTDDMGREQTARLQCSSRQALLGHARASGQSDR